MGSWSKYRIFVLLWLLTALYIAFLPTRHYTADAVNNLTYLEAHNVFESWHSQHLLGLKLGEWVYALSGLRAWQAMRIAQALMGGLTVALLYLGLQELTQRRWLPIVCGLCLWLSYGFWHYSSDPDIYSIGYVAVALLMWGYVRYLRAPSNNRVIVLGLSAAFALLSHQINVELAGLIGLSLIIGAFRKQTNLPINWRHVIFYATFSLLPTIVLYVLSWLIVSHAFAQQGTASPAFFEWLLRYFRSADSGQATWGISFGLSTLPTAIYTLLSSWILVPLLASASVWQLIPIGIFAVLIIVLLIRMVVTLIAADTLERYILWICVVTLIANGISGWWWQTGNIKFYLFMQINVIYLVGLYASKRLNNAPILHNRDLILALAALLMLLAFHVTLTLPFETLGGVFEVAAHLTDDKTVVAFQDPYQSRILPYITANKALILPADFCSALPSNTDQAVLWVVRQDAVAQCPLLASATEISRFQVDRTRVIWSLLDMTSSVQTK
ncbi:MAG: glycosyltransferase family 39 protein [Chloroflexota bacterium]